MSPFLIGVGSSSSYSTYRDPSSFGVYIRDRVALLFGIVLCCCAYLVDTSRFSLFLVFLFSSAVTLVTRPSCPAPNFIFSAFHGHFQQKYEIDNQEPNWPSFALAITCRRDNIRFSLLFLYYIRQQLSSKRERATN